MVFDERATITTEGIAALTAQNEVTLRLVERTNAKRSDRRPALL
jgi:hypothetical protein